MVNQFHFIQPLWLLALLPLALLLWWVSQNNTSSNPWRKIVDPRLLPLLMGDQQQGKHHFPLWILAISWLLAVLALADPTWEQQPQSVLQTSSARVIVLDLSRSMLAADLKPSRMARARFKVEDILAHDDEGQTGLVVFAGDAFTVTPLTRDAETIRSQLKALEPLIMPTQGSRADLGLLKAEHLLQQAGNKNGQVILIADGVEGNKATRAAAELRRAGYRVSVLGIGTAVGAPLPTIEGGVTRDASGKPRLVKLDSAALQSVAQAGGGRFSKLTGNEADINYLLDADKATGNIQQTHDVKTLRWKEQGPLLAVLLLPLAALAFRRGWLLSVMLCAGLLSQPDQVMASGWDDLWLRNDQQAAQALKNGQYEQAAKLAKDPVQRGSAEYKNGHYQEALDAFSRSQDADSVYNRGNALAKLGKYEQAIANYDEALKIQPGMEDAVANKAAVEDLLKKQQQKNPEQNKNQKQSGQQDKQESSSSSNDSSTNKGDASKQNIKEDNKEEKEARNEKPSGADEKNPTAQNNEHKQSEGKQNDKQNDKQSDNTENQFSRANQKLDDAKKNDAHNDDESTASEPPQPPTEQNKSQPVQAEKNEQPPASNHTPTKAETLTSEEKMAAQQWLRRIPDDPGGLLRRKFLYQYKQQTSQSENSATQNW